VYLFDADLLLDHCEQHLCPDDAHSTDDGTHSADATECSVFHVDVCVECRAGALSMGLRRREKEASDVLRGYLPALDVVEWSTIPDGKR
jgi:hypothetical protein